MSYSPPPVGNTPQPQALYLLPLDGSSAPELLFPPPAPEDSYLQPEWSTDGKYIYFTYYNYKNEPKDQHYPTYEVMRMAYPDGKPEKLADKAFWPNLSPDGTRMVYIASNINDGTNKVVLADPDGKNAYELLLTGAVIPDIIDAPIFSPDGQSILFSAPIPAPTPSPSWFDRLFGIEIVSAHSLPSEWWEAPLTGRHAGSVVQATHIHLSGLFASLSPDWSHIASFSSAGVFVMNPDGVELGMIVNDVGGVYGAVSWIP